MKSLEDGSQIGGKHYEGFEIQPMEFCVKNNIPFAEGSIIKYIVRYKKKNGLEDLKKAKHFLNVLIENAKDKIKKENLLKSQEDFEKLKNTVSKPKPAPKPIPASTPKQKNKETCKECRFEENDLCKIYELEKGLPDQHRICKKFKKSKNTISEPKTEPKTAPEPIETCRDCKNFKNGKVNYCYLDPDNPIIKTNTLFTCTGFDLKK